MARIKYRERKASRTEMSVRPHMWGELTDYIEQQCPECNQYKPRFFGSRMFDGTKSQFTVCRECREARLMEAAS